MSYVSLVVQSVVLALMIACSVWRFVHVRRLLWASCKHSPFSPAMELRRLLRVDDIIARAMAVLCAGGMFAVMDLWILCIGYPAIIVADYLAQWAIAYYWLRRHNAQGFYA